ncbi:MAG TPA: amidohydrolase family protein [Candidatus Limnocylindrales bacterium]|nr:amidohydrolase family protein [Candidatus Limnocylindrales bacterium]
MRTLVTGLSQVVTGDIRDPLADADSLLIEDGRFVAVARGLDEDADLVIDARGATAFPGLIDSHVHPVAGDWTPRQRATDWIESSLHGGVTSMVSAGEVHLPGRPKDIVGLKALAIVAQRMYANVRPAGVKVRAGAPILEQGLQEHDFAELAAAGVNLVGEVGLGSVKTGADAAPMLAWARAHGFVSTFHTGGPSIAGSSAIRADVVLEARPDIVGHVNGGTTALPDADIEALVASGMTVEIVHNGNLRAALHALGLAREGGVLDRVILGTDAPSGTGVVPLGILRTMAHLCSLGGLAPEITVALATGNTARVHRLDTGVIAVGRAADVAFVDAPQGSAAATALGGLAIGDLPGVGMVLVDGTPLIGRSRNTPPAARVPAVVKGAGIAGGGH